MLFNEAQWINNKLMEIDVKKISPLVNLGSYSSKVRERGQSYIFKTIMEPLEQRGVKIIHVDLENSEGVDIVGDIFDPMVHAKICSHNPRAVLCANILEHVEDPAGLAGLCVKLVPKNGVILATVPFDFPYHLAPIDTMFRPTPKELAAIFPECSVRYGEIVESETFGQQLVRSPITLAKHITRMMIPWPTFQHWKATLHRNMWLFRHYRTSCVLIEKL